MAALYDSSGQRVEQLPANVIPGERSAEEDEYIQSGFLNFLHGYTRDGDVGLSTSTANATKEYEQQVQHMQQKDKTTLEVDFMHLRNFDMDLADRVHAEYHKYDKVLRAAVNIFVKSVSPPKDSTVPPEYNIAFFNLQEQHKIRDLKSERIGCLTRITGTVTRTSEVRPELVTGQFKCMDCFTEQDPTEQQFKYTQPIICKNPTCAGRRNWYLHIDKSKFVDFQRIRVQENSNEIPAGSMPRSIDVIVRNEQVDRAKPGDKCVFTGTLIVVPDIAQLRAPGERPETVRETGARSGFSSEGVTGLKALGVRELNYKMCFLAGAIHLADTNGGFSSFRDDGEDGAQDELEPEALRDIQAMAQTPNLYSRLVSSMCPTVFGHDEVKKGVLLMLTGGMHKTTRTGTNLRGDVNVCIVGDPSTAKSQFLKYVAEFMPRAVYTSGKASSAAGLTASVVKDPETGEFGIEAGALMLADNGICCIDEFDKMDIKDQVAIHEAMEQQTISIAKAGIQATLNARTSILAAANPRDGRYDRSKTLKNNVDITAPIMSRFDLFFIILDECNEITDYNIARHIVDVHMHQERVAEVEFSKERLQRYIRHCKGLKPKLTPDAQARLIKYYSELRENDCSGSQRAAYRITVRQLESMVRLSEALAKIHCDPEVKGKYVDEAKRLLKMSIIHVDSPDIGLEEDEDDDEDDNNDEGGGGDEGGAGGEGAEKEKDQEAGSRQSSPGKRKRGKRQGGEEEGEEMEEEGAKQSEAGKDGDKEKDGEEEEAPAKKQKKKLEITQDEYSEMTHMIVRELRRREDADEEDMPNQADIVEWYLGERDDIDSEEGLVEAKRKIVAVIQRLVKIDHTLVAINADPSETEGMSKGEVKEARKRDVEQRKLSVHPSYSDASGR